jgi:hypothetical protein
MMSSQKERFVKIKATPTYKDGDKVNLYYYNTTDEKMELMAENLEVIEGHVIISLQHTSEYFITKANLGKHIK